ncbi:amidohydrolase [candidate division KSB1 bacterium]|nr:amidohydrolase [candidate division KSB1 bacterium]
MIIDAHQHVNWYGYTIEKIIQNMDEHQIDWSWILTWEGPANEKDPFFYRVSDPRGESMPLSDVVEACRRFPQRFIAGYAPDPRDPRALGRLEAAVNLYGVRVYGEWKFQMLVDSPECITLFRFCGQLKLPVVIHLDVPFLPPHDFSKPYRWWYGGTVENLERAARACPDTIFLGHGPGFWRYLSGDGATHPELYPQGDWLADGAVVPALRRCPNLYCDLSAGSARVALSRNLNFTREFVAEFQDRLLFARDYFDGQMYQLLLSLNLPSEMLTKLLAENAKRLVPLLP